MKSLTISILLAGIVAASGCAKVEKPSTLQAVSMYRCQRELAGIRGMEQLLKSRERELAEEAGKPFDGLEIALTINGTIQSESKSEDDEDNSCARANTRVNFEKIIDALKRHAMPPTVNFVAGRDMDETLQTEWIRNKNLLGSLTFNRATARNSVAAEFIESVKQNDQLLVRLSKDQPRKYFRFQRLKESYDDQSRNEIRAFLQESGYTIVPGTIDSRDWKFAQIRCSAIARGDTACADIVNGAFYSLLFDSTQKAREATRQIAGRDARQVLMVEASQFTAETLAETLSWYKRLGARFITLDEALSDPLYSTFTDHGDVQAVAVFRHVKRMQSNGEEE